jgi:5' nucleotidase, deoxy (Pyrimidine), cytosolic type C protein (NT5C)
MMIGLDIDGVLADFISPFLRILEVRIGNGPIDPESITDPNFMNHPLITTEIISECLASVSYDPNFWEALVPLASERQWAALDRLSRKQKLVFVTHRYEQKGYDIGQVTRDWLRKHGVSDPIVYFTQQHKSELIGKLKVELFVDDRHENCRDVAENTGAVVLMPHRSYNQSFNHPRVKRIQDLDELFVYLE